MPPKGPPSEVALIRAEISRYLQTEDPHGRRIGRAKCGVYAFYDYDGEPIYVGQTVEALSVRVGRHLTGRRSDAVAKFVLDPFEVLEIEVWPLFELERLPRLERKAAVDAVEFTVYDRARQASRFGAVLNEGTIQPTEPAELGLSYRARIVPDALYEDRGHPDIRLARRAQTIASLARLISERQVGRGLRQVLHVQTQRLDWLAEARLEDFADAQLELDPDDE